MGDGEKPKSRESLTVDDIRALSVAEAQELIKRLRENDKEIGKLMQADKDELWYKTVQLIHSARIVSPVQDLDVNEDVLSCLIRGECSWGETIDVLIKVINDKSTNYRAVLSKVRKRMKKGPLTIEEIKQLSGAEAEKILNDLRENKMYTVKMIFAGGWVNILLELIDRAKISVPVKKYLLKEVYLEELLKKKYAWSTTIDLLIRLNMEPFGKKMLERAWANVLEEKQIQDQEEKRRLENEEATALARKFALELNKFDWGGNRGGSC